MLRSEAGRAHDPAPHVERTEGEKAGTPVLPALQGGEDDRDDEEDGPYIDHQVLN